MKRSYLILLLVPVLLFGCKLFSASTKNAPTVVLADVKMEAASDMPKGFLAVWADGSVLITQKEFDEVLEKAMKEQPELKEMAPAFMPMLKQNLLNSLIQDKIIAKYVEEAGINKTADYKAKVDEIMKAVKQTEKVAQAIKVAKQRVNLDFFKKEFEAAVTEKEKREYYEANKGSFLKEEGGVKGTDKKANPSYEELKDQIERAIKQAKQREALMKKINELQQKYGVKVKENVFAPAQEAPVS